MRCAMSKPSTLVLALLAVIVWAPALAGEAQDIVAGADRVRNPDKPFHLISVAVAYVDPPRDAGKMLLFRGNVLWFYDPASKDSIRIPPQQILAGQASAGDLLTENLAVNYTATLKGTETIEDADRAKRNCWHLDLVPANESATYNRVEYWIETGSYNPIKAKFYSDSGRLLKILYYRNFVQSLDHVRPSGAVIIDAVNPGLVTTLDFSAMQYRDIPDYWFQRDFLPQVKSQ